ncbi:O-antigen ligase family protein [Geminicoccaceae bacterium 1502E]|nr:O-antigen ligase family protein [Geminicoccaceae bacterium 1502E]
MSVALPALGPEPTGRRRRTAIDTDIAAGMRVVRRLALHLFSFETLFVLFLFAGRFKADPRFAWVPLDITLLFFLASLAVGVTVVWRERIYLPGLRLVMLFTAFVLWACLTYAWTPGPLYGFAKLQMLLSLSIWSLMGAALVIANRRIRVVRFLVLLTVFAILIAMDWLSFYGIGHFTELGFIKSGGYLGAGVVFGAGAIVAFTVLIYAPPLTLRWIAAGLVFALLAFTLFIIGGRSPIIALVVAMLLPMAVHVRFTRRGPMMHRSQLLVLLVILAAAGGIAWTVASGELTWTLMRFGFLFSRGAEDSSTAPRLAYFAFALDGWAKAPLFGHGLGSFGIMFLGFDFRTYPHNIFLEAMFENGTVGFLLLTACFVVAMRRLEVGRLRREPVLLCSLMLLVSSLLFAVMSGAVAEERFLWTSLGLLLVRPLALTATGRPVTPMTARRLAFSRTTPMARRGAAAGPDVQPASLATR